MSFSNVFQISNFVLKFIPLLIIVVMIFSFSTPLLAQPDSDQLFPNTNLDALKSSINPKVTIQDSNHQNGHLRVQDECWWMFFLHVRPLEGAAPLGLEVPRDLIISLWENMAVYSKLTGEEGVFLLDGREAYWAEALLLNGMVRTRFIVWDDIKSGRRYIGDININIARETPDDFLLVVQDAMIKFAGGNGDQVSDLETILPKEKAFSDLGLKIRYPENCRADLYLGFDSVKPDSISSDKWGSIWVLPNSVNWRYDLVWSEDELENIESWLKVEFPNILRGEADAMPDAVVDSLRFTSQSDNRYSGTVINKIKFGEQEYPEFLKFEVSEWQENGVNYRAIVTGEEYNDMWGNYFDGSIPDEKLSQRMQEWLDCVK
jgi:hypothetical protein